MLTEYQLYNTYPKKSRFCTVACQRCDYSLFLWENEGPNGLCVGELHHTVISLISTYKQH